MPGARVHDLITVSTLAAFDVLYVAKVHPASLVPLCCFSGAYLFAGLACAGDLDTNSREYRRWGPLRFIWWPYRVLVPHRSWVSHGLIVGGIIRALYLGVMFFLLSWVGVWLWNQCGMHVDPTSVTQMEAHSLGQIMRTHPRESLAFLVGFVLAGTAHSLADIVSTGLKRWL